GTVCGPDVCSQLPGWLPPRLRFPLYGSEDGMILLDTRASAASIGPFPPLVRLRPGVTVAAASARLPTIQGEEIDAGKTALRLVPVREDMAARQDPVLWLLVAAAAVV